MFKKLAALAEGFHNRLLGVEAIEVSNRVVDTESNSYITVCEPGGYLVSYALTVTMFDGVLFGKNGHYRRVWTMAERLVGKTSKGHLSYIHINGENFKFDEKGAI